MFYKPPGVCVFTPSSPVSRNIADAHGEGPVLCVGGSRFLKSEACITWESHYNNKKYQVVNMELGMTVNI